VPRGEGSGEAADESMPCEPIDDRLFEFTRASARSARFFMMAGCAASYSHA
jgi:hypothetical protein